MILSCTVVESFNARLRDELLNGEIFYTLREAQVVIESWRRHYNRVRPHASLGYRAPAMAGRPLGQPGGLWPIRGGSIKPCQVFIGADTDYGLTFRLEHSMGAGHFERNSGEKQYEFPVKIHRKTVL